MRTLIIILFFFINGTLFAQCPSTEYTIASDLCLNQRLLISNSTISGVNYNWDFCGEDLSNIPTASSLGANGAYNLSFDLEIMNDNNRWYGFINSRSSDAILRNIFNDDLRSNPTTESLPNTNSIVDPNGFTLYQVDGEWYGLMVNIVDSRLVRYSFGDSLSNEPTEELLEGIGLYEGNNDITSVVDEDSIYTFVAGDNAASLVRLRYAGTSPSVIKSDTIPIAGYSEINDIQLIRECDSWYGLITSFTDSKVSKLSFGTSLSSIPSLTDISGSFPSATKAELVVDGADYYGFVQLRGGDLVRLDFGSSMVNIPDVINLGDLGVLSSNSFAFSMGKDSSAWTAFGIGFTNNNLYQITFPDDCSASVAESSEFEPNGVSYSTSGRKYITLKAIDAEGHVDYYLDSVDVSMDIAPDIDFNLSSSRCITSSITFTPTITGLTSYSWDFDDDGIEDSNEENPQVLFDTLGGPGTYLVRVDVNDGTCDNFYEEEITIYPEPPTPTLNITTSGTFCTNNEFTLTNTTDETGYDDVLTYQWVIDGDTANQKDTVYTFLSSGVKTITLQSFVPGCSSTLTSQDITINEGPDVSFNYTNNCFGEPIQFTSEVIGADITGYAWDFGDGEGTSSQSDTVYQYLSAGTYTVQLTVMNGTGCETTYSEEIEVNDGQLADFTIGEAIENLPTEFSGLDLTLSNDSIVSWNWDFDGLGTSSSKDASFTFDEGSFTVTLSILTAQGCGFQVDKPLNVLASSCPTGAFTSVADLCIEGLLELTNLSVNSNSYEWDFCQGEIEFVPSALSLQENTDYNDAFDIEIVGDHNLWYGFVSSRNGIGSVLRLNYGDSLSSNPSVSSLENSVGISGPNGISFYQVDGEWYGLMVNIVDSRLVRYSFGDSLSNEPTEELLEGIGLYEGNNDITSVVDEDSIYTFVAGDNAASLVRLRYAGTSPSVIKSDTIPIAGYSEINDIQLIRECDSWYGLITSFTDSKVSKLSFGTSLSSIPSLTDISGSFPSATKAELVVDGADYYGFVQLRGGDLVRLDFGSSMVNIPDVINLGDLGVLSSNSFAFSMGKDSSAWTAFGIGFTNNNLYQITFPDDCSASVAESSEFEPNGVSYSTSGRKYITLKAIDAEGHVDYYLDSVDVSMDIAPDIDFNLSSSRCITSSITFTPTITGLTSYSWDFDDDGIEDSNEENPQVLFDTLGGPGTYLVRVDVNDGTCDNFYEEEITIYPEPPTPTFDSSFPALCENVTFNFTNTIDSSGYNGIMEYRWFLNESEISTDRDLELSFDTPGEKIIGLQAHIPGCESIIVQDTFNITPAPIADFQADTICLSETLFLTNNSSNASTYSWDFGDGETSTLIEPTKVYADTGTFQITLVAIDASGDCNDTQIQTVRVNRNPPTPTFDIESIPFCIGSEISLSNTTSDGSFNSEVTYVWTVTDLGEFTSKDVILTFAESGQKNIQLKSIYRSCESTITSQVIEVNDLPTPNFSATSVCQDESMQFTNQSTNAVSYFWDFGDGFTSTSENPSHVYTTAGNYDVSLTATSANGCDSEITIEVSVSDIPQVNFDFEVPCNTESGVSFTDLSTVNNADIVGWQWFVEGVEVSTEQNPTLNFAETGVINVSLAVISSNGCESTYNEDIEIQPSPSPDFSSTIGCVGEETSFDDMTVSSSTIISWLWFVDGVSYTTENVSHVFDDFGSYEVSLEVTSQNFCAESITKTIEILQPPTVDFSMDGDCDNVLIEVLDLSTEFNDPIISRTWRLNDEEVGNGSLLYLNQLASESYTLTLEVLTESGCISSVSQPLEINDSPTSSFTSSRTYGLPNDQLTFTNTSDGATAFEWLLNGEPAGNDPNAETYLFSDAGTHVIGLVALNSLGCVDTTNQEILIEVPEIDLSIGSFDLVQENNTGKIFLEIQNLSNLPVESFEAQIVLENQFTVTEQINTFIDIGETTLVSLNVGIPLVTSEPAYFCVSLSSPYVDYEDLNPIDNEKCLTIQPKVRVEDPFPNPVSDEFRLKVIVPNEGAVKLTLLNSAGKIQTERIYSASTGLNNFIFDMSLLDPGIYYITVDVNGELTQRKVIKL
ncbi:PKD domain-containing protein [Ekhidna sp.]|uniref:PKD domain-containing protein n=1 Tax=Ekhidna sp. TaxID=2608089 RepID=UPI003BACACE5